MCVSTRASNIINIVHYVHLEDTCVENSRAFIEHWTNNFESRWIKHRSGGNRKVSPRWKERRKFFKTHIVRRNDEGSCLQCAAGWSTQLGQVIPLSRVAVKKLCERENTNGSKNTTTSPGRYSFLLKCNDACLPITCSYNSS